MKRKTVVFRFISSLHSATPFYPRSYLCLGWQNVRRFLQKTIPGTSSCPSSYASGSSFSGGGDTAGMTSLGWAMGISITNSTPSPGLE